MDLHPRLLQQFCELQARLFSAVVRDHPQVRLPEDIRAIPAWTEIRVEDSRWRVHRHGAGFTFEEAGGGRVVSMHDSLPHADVVCGWRLALYLESLGRAELDEAEIEAALEAALKRGMLRRAGPGRFSIVLRG